MLKRKAWIVLLCGVMCGCGQNSKTVKTASPSVSASAVSTSSVETVDTSSYLDTLKDVKSADSWTASVESNYQMHYEDDSDVIYSMNGTLEADQVSSRPEAHLHMNIDSDGMPAELDSYYYEGRLYSVYNNVEFYEDQDFSSVEKTLMVPLEAIQITSDQIFSVSKEETDDETIWTIMLNQNGAESIFRSSYDFYDLSTYDDYQVSSGTLKQTFDGENHLIAQSSSFQASVSYQNSPVSVTADTTLSFTDLDQTQVRISDDLKQKQKSYASYQDIDTSAISSVDPSEDDEGENAIETFKRRLVYRLGYQLQEDGTYLAEFNEHESYRVDFDNHQFIYTNYTSSYVYNWKGDEGGFGSTCNYNFSSERATDDCEESVIEQIRNTKSFLLMELYYCGLSLDDLQQAS